MKSLLDKEFRYTPVAAQGADYLRMRFAQIRAQIEANKKEAAMKVQPIKSKRNA
jgi:hypothetical protein